MSDQWKLFTNIRSWHFKLFDDIGTLSTHPDLTDFFEGLDESQINCSGEIELLRSLPTAIREYLKDLKPIKKGQSTAEIVRIGSLNVLNSDPEKTKHFFGHDSRDIAIFQKLHFSKRFMNKSVDEKLLGSKSAIHIDLLLSNSNAELHRHSDANILSDRDFTDELVSLKALGKQYHFNPNSDQITEYPLEIDGVDFKAGLMLGRIKLSDYHQQKIIEAVKAFPDFNFDVTFVCQLSQLSHEMKAQSIRLDGVIQIDPKKITISTSSSQRRRQ